MNLIDYSFSNKFLLRLSRQRGSFPQPGFVTLPKQSHDSVRTCRWAPLLIIIRFDPDHLISLSALLASSTAPLRRLPEWLIPYLFAGRHARHRRFSSASLNTRSFTHTRSTLRRVCVLLHIDGNSFDIQHSSQPLLLLQQASASSSLLLLQSRWRSTIAWSVSAADASRKRIFIDLPAFAQHGLAIAQIYTRCEER